VHAINVDGSMPGVLGGVSNKVYKEVVKTPNAIARQSFAINRYFLDEFSRIVDLDSAGADFVPQFHEQ
jgi:hypothetical protein